MKRGGGITGAMATPHAIDKSENTKVVSPFSLGSSAPLQQFVGNCKLA